MSADQRNSPVDLKQLRHDLAGAIGTLETAILEIRPHTTDAEDGIELYQLGIERLRELLKSLDRTSM